MSHPISPSRLLAPYTLPLSLAVVFFLSACQTVPSRDKLQRDAMIAAIQAEQPGDYFIGRRYFKKDYKMWGYVREPGKMWNTARMVMLNENVRLAPDRQQGRIGADNGYEYRLYGKFSGDTVYEPASNRFYPEFVIYDYDIVSTEPAPIFKTPAALDPSRRVIEEPY